MDSLPILQPDSERTARTLTRCHHLLAQRRIAATRPRSKAVIVERAVLTSLCAAYLLSVVSAVVRMVYRG